ncbi:hypothetical protein TWF694_010968 [Orbilia ellipsospora]|uniref:Ankyrin n=1 Tax=Orbilia ellipsospora TaxID=2528407 RepID=A0AAV9XDV2_9PEZI
MISTTYLDYLGTFALLRGVSDALKTVNNGSQTHQSFLLELEGLGLLLRFIALQDFNQKNMIHQNAIQGLVLSIQPPVRRFLEQWRMLQMNGVQILKAILSAKAIIISLLLSLKPSGPTPIIESKLRDDLERLLSRLDRSSSEPTWMTIFQQCVSSNVITVPDLSTELVYFIHSFPAEDRKQLRNIVKTNILIYYLLLHLRGENDRDPNPFSLQNSTFFFECSFGLDRDGSIYGPLAHLEILDFLLRAELEEFTDGPTCLSKAFWVTGKMPKHEPLRNTDWTKVTYPRNSLVVSLVLERIRLQSGECPLQECNGKLRFIRADASRTDCDKCGFICRIPLSRWDITCLLTVLTIYEPAPDAQTGETTQRAVVFSQHPSAVTLRVLEGKTLTWGDLNPESLNLEWYLPVIKVGPINCEICVPDCAPNDKNQTDFKFIELDIDNSDRISNSSKSTIATSDLSSKIRESVQKGDLGKCVELLAAGADVHSIDPESKNSLLYTACAEGQYAIARLLLQMIMVDRDQAPTFQNLFPGYHSQDLSSILHRAVERGISDIVECLLDGGVGLGELPPYLTNNLLHRNLMTISKDLALAYLDTNPCFEDNINGLRLAWWNAGAGGEEEIVTTVIEKFEVMAGEHAASDDAFQNCIDGALTGAVSNGHINIIEKLLDKNLGTIKPKLLNTACRCGRFHVVLHLLRLGAAPQPSNITMAVEGGSMHIVRHLVDIGVEPSLEAFESASQLVSQDIFVFLSEKFPDLARKLDSAFEDEDTKSSADYGMSSKEDVLIPLSRPPSYQSEWNPDAVRKEEPASKIRRRWLTWSPFHQFSRRKKENFMDLPSGDEKKSL